MDVAVETYLISRASAPSMPTLQLEGSPTAARVEDALSSYHSSPAAYAVFASKYF